MSLARISVVVVDDHPLFREGITRAVRERPDLELVGEADDGQRALDLIRTIRPAVAVLDFALPGLNGLQVLAAVARDKLPTQVLMLSAAIDGPIVFQAMSAGAAGYMPKTATRQEVCDAVATIARGGTVLDDTLQTGLLKEVRARGIDDARPSLTAREAEILPLMAEGLSAPEIGARLVVATSTVKTHMGHLYEKLEVSDRAACVAEAMRRGLIE